MHRLNHAKRLMILLLAGVLLATTPAAGRDRKPVVDKTHPREMERTATSASQISDCSACHACERPTRADPCLNACPRYESHFSSHLHADSGPDVVIIDQLADLYGPIVFAHRVHAEMSEMSGGCQNCHHYSEDTGTIPSCRECHDEKHNRVDLSRPSLKGAYHRQCMNCHIDWSHENACEFCHEQADHDVTASAVADSTDIVGIPHPLITADPTFSYKTSHEDGPIVTFHHTDHVDKFGLQCVDCHRGDSCSRCHDAQSDARDQANQMTSCVTCHEERNCSFCHKDRIMPEFEHGTSTGWSLAPYHSDADCESCHGRPEAFHTPTSRCADCHIHWEDGAFEHAVTGLTLDETHEDIDCDTCHPGLEVDRTPVCDDCHDDPMYPDLLPGRRR